MKTLLAIVIFLCPFIVFSNEIQAFYIKGDVSINGKKAVEKNSYSYPLIISTKDKSLLILKSSSQSLKIAANTNIKIDGVKKVDISSGSTVINYLRSKTRSSESLKVNTRTVSIGIRGTKFIVYADKEGKTFLTVDDGEVSFKGSGSKEEILVGPKQSAITNKLNQNLSPKEYGFEKFINWELDNVKVNLDHSERLASAFEELWNRYKDEQEYIWKNLEKDNKDVWDNWKKSNGGNFP